MTAPLRRVPIPPDAAARVDRRDRADAWQDKLLSMGLMMDASPAEARRRDWTPAGSIARLRRDVVALRDIEARTLALQTHKPFRGGAAPVGILAAGGIALLLLIQHQGLLVGASIAALGFGLLGAVGLVVVRRFDKRKTAGLAGLVEERGRLLDALLAELAQLTSRSFVARIGRSVLSGRADLDALERAEYEAGRRAADLQRLGRNEEAAPLRGLRTELKAEIAVLQARYRALESDPPEAWTDEGLGIDRAAWARRLRALDLSFDLAEPDC